MAVSDKILFLTLRTFSATGGIEKVCRVFSRALGTLEDKGLRASMFSMYDRQEDERSRYTAGITFRGFSLRKPAFVLSAVREGLRSDTIVLSHINLLSVGWLIKLLAPRKKLMLFTHGIEVWRSLSPARRMMLRRCDRLIAVSRYTRDQLISMHGVPEEKITVLNNCIDPFLPAPGKREKPEELMQRYGFLASDFVLMTLSRLSSSELYKGYDHVLLVIAELEKKYPGIKYLIVGKSDATERQRLEAIVQQFRISDRVVFTGYVPDEELAAHFSLADLYIMPSKKEGFGIVFIEAMYYGLPVIAGNRDGSTDALCQGRLGLLVNPDDLDEIIAAVEKVIAAPEQYQPDRKLLMEQFSFDTYCRQVMALTLTH